MRGQPERLRDGVRRRNAGRRRGLRRRKHDPCDGCGSSCQPAPNGVEHKGVCLAGVQYGQSGPPGPPVGCTPFQPGAAWVEGDFTTLCNLFSSNLGMPSSCSSYDTDADGGSCSNGTELMVWDNDTNVDVWLNSNSWAFSPPGSGSCNQQFGSAHIAVYACQ